ncbi:MAG: GspE/PulE family protein [Minisyncoccia bacterium]
MVISITNLARILIDNGLVKDVDFDKAFKISEKEKLPIEVVLVQRKYISDHELGEAIATFIGFEYVDLKFERVTNELMKLIPEEVARAQRAVFFDMTEDTFKLATVNPENYEFIKLLEKNTKKKISVYYTTPLGIEDGLKYYSTDIEKKIKILLKHYQEINDDQDIIKMVDTLIEYGYNIKASDIHIEPLDRETVIVRYRIDGVLYKSIEYPATIHPKIVFRVKIMSRLHTDEHSATQDGKFPFKMENENFDVRVSVLPVTNGENIVLRILSERARKISITELGLSDLGLEKVKEIINKPHGMILSAGATGSGKTTTLYALIQVIDKHSLNVVTIEDPVEYAMENVQQIQVNLKKDLTFANGLRSIVRQDPDVIMVGEIRDAETATIAVNAAMTGHVLFSSIHANDSVTVFPRLEEMGIEPFLVASSVNLIIAQKLVRKICEVCKISYSPIGKELEVLNKYSNIKESFEKFLKIQDVDLSKIKLYKGSGCKVCNHTGYDGRIGVFELLEVNDKIREMIKNRVSSNDIQTEAKNNGMETLDYGTLVKVILGITTLEEAVDFSKL